jgi:opacity protein-like surface antigen
MSAAPMTRARGAGLVRPASSFAVIGLPRVCRILCALAILLCAGGADAQSLEVHGFFDVGAMRFSATDSFDAVFGSPVGIVFGGGGGVVLPQNIFIDVRASRFKKDGQRVFVNDGDVFELGITNTVTITPFEISAGYRFGRSRDVVRPYAGGGVSWYRYEETDQFATADESFKDTYTGFHLLGGAEIRVSKWLGIAGEAAWTTVPNGLGQQPGSVGTGFDETDLGGTTFRAKVVIGR